MTCVPGSGGKETGMVPILDTLFCSVFLGVRRYKEGEKIMRGEGYTDCWEKVWGWPPITIGEPGAGQATRCSRPTGRYSSGYRRAFFGRVVP